MHCHPGYGHGKRQEGTFNPTEIGNGYLLVIYDDNDNYIASLTGMPQLFAVEPFKAPIDPSKIKITWKPYTDSWNNTFEDGTTYELIYPEVTIPADAYYVDLITTDGRTLSPDQVNIRLESTIGIYGTGLLDAISDEDLKAQYAKQEKDNYFALNPRIFQNGEWVNQYSNNRPSDGGTGEKHPYRYTYALSRGPLQDGAGSNAIWNITNVTRSNRRYHYMTKAYAEKASKDPEVQARFYDLFPDRKTDAGVEQDIYDYLMAKDLPVEMSDKYFTDLMVWHRGLAVPAARNLDDATVQRGKQLFTEMGCSYCHRPTWTTGDDHYSDPSRLLHPRYRTAPLSPTEDMALHRSGATPPAHAERHTHRLVPHDSPVGQRAAPEVYRLVRKRPAARLPGPQRNRGHHVARSSRKRCPVVGRTVPKTEQRGPRGCGEIYRCHLTGLIGRQCPYPI